jgi:hypothetical protein
VMLGKMYCIPHLTKIVSHLPVPQFLPRALKYKTVAR